MIATITTVPSSATRRIETPAAVMTTLASPSLGATEVLSVWRVEMAAGSSGPTHRIDSEQVWTVLSGAARVLAVDGEVAVEAGDTVVLPAGLDRTIVADASFVALVAGRGDARAQVPGEPEDRGTPPWMA